MRRPQNPHCALALIITSPLNGPTGRSARPSVTPSALVHRNCALVLEPCITLNRNRQWVPHSLTTVTKIDRSFPLHNSIICVVNSIIYDMAVLCREDRSTRTNAGSHNMQQPPTHYSTHHDVRHSIRLNPVTSNTRLRARATLDIYRCPTSHRLNKLLRATNRNTSLCSAPGVDDCSPQRLPAAQLPSPPAALVPRTAAAALREPSACDTYTPVAVLQCGGRPPH